LPNGNNCTRGTQQHIAVILTAAYQLLYIATCNALIDYIALPMVTLRHSPIVEMRDARKCHKSKEYAE
jgi:hypothetical protein